MNIQEFVANRVIDYANELKVRDERIRNLETILEDSGFIRKSCCGLYTKSRKNAYCYNCEKGMCVCCGIKCRECGRILCSECDNISPEKYDNDEYPLCDNCV